MLIDPQINLGTFCIASRAYQLFFGSWLTKVGCI